MTDLDFNDLSLASSGKLDVEINLQNLARQATSRRTAPPFVEEFVVREAKRLCVHGEGHFIKLFTAEDHPAIVMDMSFGGWREPAARGS